MPLSLSERLVLRSPTNESTRVLDTSLDSHSSTRVPQEKKDPLREAAEPVARLNTPAICLTNFFENQPSEIGSHLSEKGVKKPVS